MSYERPPTDLRKAIPLILLAALANALMIVLVKIASQAAAPQVILFARYIITLLILMPFIFFKTGRNEPIHCYLATKRFPLHLLRDVFGFLGLLAYFYAAKYVSLADATVLFNTAPLFIPLIAFFWGRIKIVHRLWWGIGVGFLGVVLIVKPDHALLNIASIVGLLAGFCSAMVLVGGRYLTYSEPPLRTMFYYFAVGTVLGLILLIIKPENLANIFHVKKLLLLLGVGVFGYLYQFFINSSIKFAPVRLTSSFLYAGVVFSLLFDWLLWHVIPTALSIAGILLIIFGACLLMILYPAEDYQKR
jgi:drug/metabolite transporter (DMT)-like permease